MSNLEQQAYLHGFGDIEVIVRNTQVSTAAPSDRAANNNIPTKVT